MSSDRVERIFRLLKLLNTGGVLNTEELATRLEGGPMMPLGLVPNC